MSLSACRRRSERRGKDSGSVSAPRTASSATSYASCASRCDRQTPTPARITPPPPHHHSCRVITDTSDTNICSTPDTANALANLGVHAIALQHRSSKCGRKVHDSRKTKAAIKSVGCHQRSGRNKAERGCPGPAGAGYRTPQGPYLGAVRLRHLPPQQQTTRRMPQSHESRRDLGYNSGKCAQGLGSHHDPV